MKRKVKERERGRNGNSKEKRERERVQMRARERERKVGGEGEGEKTEEGVLCVPLKEIFVPLVLAGAKHKYTTTTRCQHHVTSYPQCSVTVCI